jgi:hypothetical protein
MDDAIVWNTIKGLDNDYKKVGNLASLLISFPTFLQFCNMLLLQEFKPSNMRSPSSTDFYSTAPPQYPRVGHSGYGAPTNH